MNNKYQILTITCLLIFLNSGAQTAGRNLFVDAEFDLLDKAYTTALAKFERVLETDTSNCNYQYRTGFCLVNIPGRMEEAIPYLEKASRKTTSDYKEGNYKEENAPIDVFLYLGNAYKSKNEMQKAESAYNTFLSKVDKSDTEKLEYVDRQMKSIKIAASLKNNPVSFKKHNLGSTINNERMNYSPCISGDMNTLAFTSFDLNGVNFIYICNRDENGNWSKPRDITRTIGSSGDCKTSDLNSDGSQLLLVKQDNFDSDIYMAEFKDGKWAKMFKMNKYINAKNAWQSHASFSSDDKSIYFASHRKKGLGGQDIYVSKQDESGWWGFADNLGSPVNTEFDEETPFLTSDNTLYFSSNGHNTMGGYDIFFAKQKSDGQWENPINIGYPINTVNDDIFYVPMPDNQHALYAVFYEEGFGGLDIYEYEIFNENNPRTFTLSGIINFPAGYTGTKENLTASLQHNNGFEINKINVSSAGEFNYELKHGSYNVIFNQSGLEETSATIYIPEGYTSDTYFVNMYPVMESVMAEELLTENNSLLNSNTLTENTGELLQTENTQPLQKNEITNNISMLNNDRENMDELNEVKKVPSLLSGNNTNSPVKNTKAGPPVIKNNNSPPSLSESSTLSSTKSTGQQHPVHTDYLQNNSAPLYTIQVMALKKYKEPENVSTMPGIMVFKATDGYYHYVYGRYNEREMARNDLSFVISKGFRFAYIMKMDYFIKNLSKSGYTIQIMALKNYSEPENIKNNDNYILKISLGPDGYYRYTIGQYFSMESARKELQKVKNMGHSNAYIRSVADIPGY